MGKMKVWYDADGDYLELGMTGQKGSFKDVGHDIWERVDTKGRIIGVAIANFLKRKTLKNGSRSKLNSEQYSEVPPALS